MEPGIHDPHLDQTINPLLREQIKVRLTQACTNTRHHFVIETILQTFHRLAQDIESPTAFIADDFISLNTDQGRDIACASQSLRDLLSDEVAVGKYLKVTIRVPIE